ncbi:MAG TPA: Gfo/Idh/MocA family oxidoreductase [Candidatus Limnocylindrales bacterium]|jgi:predicted dehydrogenase|nr:Gfo/Idh/MocA family oxidoreductase [Candidatus Limnocylindrales bacterium]
MSDDRALPGSGEGGRLRLGVIGAGTWAVAAHIPGLLRRPEVEPWIVSRRDEALLEEIRARFGFARATTDWREVIEARPDIVALTGPVHLRAEQALAAIDAGIHILAEKPFTIDPADAWAIEQRARERGVHVVLCYAWNEMGISEQAHRLIDGPDGIGRVEHVSVEMSTIVRDLLLNGRTYVGEESGAPLPRTETWSDPSISGGGYGQGQLTHALGLVLRLVPSLRASQVAAFTSSPDSAVELHDVIAVRFDDGTIASIGGASLPFGTFGNVHQLRIRVTGERGQVVLDMTAPRVARSLGGDDIEVDLSDDDVLWSFDRVTDRLVDLVIGRTTANPSPASLGARVVEILDGMYRSAADGTIASVAR